MKITFVCPYAGLAGGVRVVAIYADRLRRLGHEVFLVSKPKPKPPIKRQVRSFLTRNRLASNHRDPSYFDNINVPHKILEKPRPVVDADVPDADVIIATWWQTAEDVANLSPSKGAKVYFIQQHETFASFPVERVKATYSLPLHKITISKWLHDLMQVEYGDTDVSLVLNSVDTQQFHAPKRKKRSVPTVGMLYHSMFHKGCDISFKALSIAAQKIPNLQMVSFGACPSPPEFPVTTEYIQKPAQDQIKEIYARCDVWLCGSRSEGFHLPPLEAMACRCPIVSTEVGGPVDIMQDGVNGYLVPVEDYEALADRLVRVLSLPEEDWQAMSDEAYAVATQYTWDDATKLFEQALHTAMCKRMLSFKLQPRETSEFIKRKSPTGRERSQMARAYQIMPKSPQSIAQSQFNGGKMRFIKDSVKTILAKQGYTLERKSPPEVRFKSDLDTFQQHINGIAQRHREQTPEYVNALKHKYENTFFGKFYVWDIVNSLSRCFDLVDIRLGVGSQEIHVLQMLEGMEQDGITDPDMLLAAIIHDMGKVLLTPHEPPENIVFDNYIIGEYEDGIGLDNCTLTYSQDEYLYSRLKDHLPDHLAWLIRYHGINIPKCSHLMDARDREYTDRYLRTFAKYDLGTKSFYHFPKKKIEDYRGLVERAFPEPILF